MREITQPAFPPLPYSLHDMHITSMEIDGNTLTLIFDYGYCETKPPYRQVQGNIRIEGLDLDFCSVYLLEYTDVPCGNHGTFRGQKLSLHDFIRSSDRISVDIMDETYGYHMMKLNGFVSFGTDMLEGIFEISYTGAVTYLIQD